MSSDGPKIFKREVLSGSPTSVRQRANQTVGMAERFNWFASPSEWLTEISSFDCYRDLRWLTAHHQILTLAQKTGASIALPGALTKPSLENRDRRLGLWFRFDDVFFGAVLPGRDKHDRVLVITQAGLERDLRPIDIEAIFDFLQARSLMYAEDSILLQDFDNQEFREKARQTARLRNDRPPRVDTHEISLRRATTLDVVTLNRWARIFDPADPSGTTREVSALVKSGTLFLASSGRELFGMIGLAATLEGAEGPLLTRITLAFVDPEYRGQGLGSKMLEALCNEIELEQNGRPILFSDSKNPLANQFYQRLGFDSCGDWVVLQEAE